MATEQEQKAILEKFIFNNKDLKELETKISRFNIFEAVGMVRQEIKHSNFLQFLLNPLEKHQLSYLFLKRLLIEVLGDTEDTSSDDLDIANSCFEDAKVRREWRYIDLLIHSPSNNFVCVIENKVDSTEGFNQLQTYKSVIDREFPHCKKLFIYLTKEGDTASQSDWLTLSYGTIADIIEKICEERQASLSLDIEISMCHYVDLIRRHLMSQSDIAELCRTIYKKHRQAIDLIYEHRPDMRSDIEAYLSQLIQEFSESANIGLDSIKGKWIRFAPKEWDTLAFQSTCSSGWSIKNRLLLLEFWNEPQSLQLRIVVGPGELGTKEAIYQKLRSLNVPGIRKIKIKISDYSQVGIIQVLSASDYEDDDLEELQTKIRAFWLNFINGDLKAIRDVIFEAFEKTTD